MRHFYVLILRGILELLRFEARIIQAERDANVRDYWHVSRLYAEASAKIPREL